MSHQNAGNPAKVYPYSHHNRPDAHEDLAPSDVQPAGVDEEREPQSLGEALTG